MDNILEFYLTSTKLKYLIRSGWDKDHWDVLAPRLESVAEHVYGTCILAIAMDSEYDFNIDINKVIKMLVIHEIGEVIIGDITPFENVSIEEKNKIEHEAVMKILSPLSKCEEYYDLMIEFDKHETKESIFAYYCDKMEADIQSKYYQDNNYHHDLYDNVDNKFFNSDRFLNNLHESETAFEVWYKHDIDKFSDSEEFTNLLKLVKKKDISSTP